MPRRKPVKVEFTQGGKVVIICGKVSLELSREQAMFVVQTIVKVLDPPLLFEPDRQAREGE